MQEVAGAFGMRPSNYMRCGKCGYDGIENVANGKCIKCGELLQGNGEAMFFQGMSDQEAQLKKTVIQTGNFCSDNVSSQYSDLKKTVVQGYSSNQSNDNIKETVKQGGNTPWEGAAFGNGPKKPEKYDESEHASHECYKPVTVNGKLECPNCHYPLSSDNLPSCPNCMADFTGQDDEEDGEEQGDVFASSQPDVQYHEGDNTQILGTIYNGHSHAEGDDVPLIECTQCKKQISATFKYCPYCAAEVIQKTVAFRKKRKGKEDSALLNTKPDILQKPENFRCSLSLLPDTDEDIEAITNNYEGKNIILNRANTEPGNSTITSKEQAELSYEDGNWYIENHSQYGTTFVAVNRRTQLHPGDVVMLGDRRFIFAIDEPK